MLLENLLSTQLYQIQIYQKEKNLVKNLTTKRPGTGYFPASKIYSLYGKTSKRNIKKNRLIGKNDIQ